jgi:uncharacterized protein YjiS (DUF1127 family)
LAPPCSAFFKQCLRALQERRKRARLRTALHALPDRDLRDIGISRSEIEYLALNGTDEHVDPRLHPSSSPRAITAAKCRPKERLSRLEDA